MASKIEWTGDTWNPLAGCTIVSPGCANCYAMREAHRFARHPNEKVSAKYAGTTTLVKGKPVWTGRVNVAHEEAILKPLRTKKPTMYFVNSMSDLFHENVPYEVVDRIFAIMALCPQHTFQLLTKRSARMREYMTSIGNGDGERIPGWRDAMIEGMAQKLHHEMTGEYPSLWLAVNLPLRNVWLGVSAEDQPRADQRIPDLLATPAAVRFVSAEPLLGPLRLPPELLELRNRAWVIVGGETGKGSRPMHPEWARDIRDQCFSTGMRKEDHMPFFFKQWGDWTSVSAREGDGEHHTFPDGVTVRRIGKKAAGRLLDGIEHNATPEVLP